MASVLIVLTVIGFALGDPCDAAAINSTVSYKENDKFLEIIKNIFAKITPGLDYLGRLPTHAATSCQQIANLRPHSSSGLYWIQVGSSPSRVYCDMNMT